MAKVRKKRTTKKKYIKIYYNDKDLLYGSAKNLNRNISWIRVKLVSGLKYKLSEEFHKAGLDCVRVVIVRGTRIMFNVHGKWFLPHYSNGVAGKCPRLYRECKQWSEKCIFTVLNDKSMEKLNGIMDKVDEDQLLKKDYLKELIGEEYV